MTNSERLNIYNLHRKDYRRYLRVESIKGLFRKSYKPLKGSDYFQTSKFYGPYIGKSNGYTEYSNYLAEQLDKTINYTEYLADKVSNSNTYIKYSEYIAEEINKKFNNI